MTPSAGKLDGFKKGWSDWNPMDACSDLNAGIQSIYVREQLKSLT
jgi:hypothetical protein